MIVVFRATRDSRVSADRKLLFANVIKHIEGACRQVNQLLLLEDLHTTRLCSVLLEAEADEDVRWAKSQHSRNRNTHGAHEDSDSGALHLTSTASFKLAPTRVL